MKSYSKTPLTPRMIVALKELRNGKTLEKTLEFENTCVGRPTKQRLAKFGLAYYMFKDWDGPMRITTKGLKKINHISPYPTC